MGKLKLFALHFFIKSSRFIYQGGLSSFDNPIIYIEKNIAKTAVKIKVVMTIGE